MAYMTRDEMAAVIRQGQSVLHKGRLYTAEANLPTEADLALESGDPAKHSEARESLLAAKAVLEAQIAKFDEAIPAQPHAPAPSGATLGADEPPAKPKAEVAPIPDPRKGK